MFMCNIGIDCYFCWLMQTDEDRPRDAGDAGGPSSRRDEDQSVPHDDSGAMHASDDATRDVAEGCLEAAVDDQSREG
jgi:hypothetical protein